MPTKVSFEALSAPATTSNSQSQSRPPAGQRFSKFTHFSNSVASPNLKGRETEPIERPAEFSATSTIRWKVVDENAFLVSSNMPADSLIPVQMACAFIFMID